MFCILLANLRKQVKIPYNLLGVNEHFEDECNAKITLLDNFLLLPMERSKVCITTLPARFTHRVDDKRHDNDDNTARNEDCHPCLRISGRYLCRRYKAEHKGEQGAAETESGDNPHRKVTTQTERAIAVAHTVAKNDCRSKEHHIHNKV